MQSLLWEEFTKYQALPLDASVATRLVAPRPNVTAGKTVFTYSDETVTGIPHGDAPSLLDTSYTISAEVDTPPGGAEGMIHTNGGPLWRPRYVFAEGEAGVRLESARFEAGAVGGAGSALTRQAYHRVRFRYDGLGLATLAFNNMSGIGPQAPSY